MRRVVNHFIHILQWLVVQNFCKKDKDTELEMAALKLLI